MPGDDQLVEVYGLLLGHPVETEVVEDEQVRGEEGAEGLVRGVVDPGLSHGPEEVVGMYEADGVPGSDGSISESKRSEWVPAAVAGGLALFVLTISLFGPERERASRFLRPTFVSGNSGPEFAAPYTTRRVCVDRVHDGIATSTLNRAG